MKIKWGTDELPVNVFTLLWVAVVFTLVGYKYTFPWIAEQVKEISSFETQAPATISTIDLCKQSVRAQSDALVEASSESFLKTLEQCNAIEDDPTQTSTQSRRALACKLQETKTLDERNQTLMGTSFIEALRCDPNEYAQFVERCADPYRSQAFCSYIPNNDVGSER